MKRADLPFSTLRPFPHSPPPPSSVVLSSSPDDPSVLRLAVPACCVRMLPSSPTREVVRALRCSGSAISIVFRALAMFWYGVWDTVDSCAFLKSNC